mmetsp:Transcript_55375/g.49864  ORF Transcript_55375/g.49864 Transcript_55375/m.49864 type:complete len:100 (+) Transcript_55375:91-390(+)
MISVASGIHSAKNKDIKVQQNVSLNANNSKYHSQNNQMRNLQNRSQKINKPSVLKSNDHFGLNRFYQMYQMGSYHQSHHVQRYSIPSPKLLGNQFKYHL